MIYFVRHGETDYNKENRVQGWHESVLTNQGILQAQNVAKELSLIKFDTIYSSPLKRTQDTAQIINHFQNVEILTDERIKERFAGNRENTLFYSHTKDEIADFFAYPEKFGAETDEKLYKRVISFYKEIENKKGNILIVSHGGVYKCIYRYVNNISNFNLPIKSLKNCEFVKLKD